MNECNCNTSKGYSIRGHLENGICVSIHCIVCGGFVPRKLDAKEKTIKELRQENLL